MSVLYKIRVGGVRGNGLSSLSEEWNLISASSRGNKAELLSGKVSKSSNDERIHLGLLIVRRGTGSSFNNRESQNSRPEVTDLSPRPLWVNGKSLLTLILNNPEMNRGLLEIK